MKDVVRSPEEIRKGSNRFIAWVVFWIVVAIVLAMLYLKSVGKLP